MRYFNVHIKDSVQEKRPGWLIIQMSIDATVDGEVNKERADTLHI